MMNEDCRYRTTMIEPHHVASRLLAILVYIVGVLRRQWLETEVRMVAMLHDRWIIFWSRRFSKVDLKLQS